MFNDGFYPSTPEVIELMIAPFVRTLREESKRYISGVQRILEPSAGKGDILDYLRNNLNAESKDFSCCEIEDELAMILNEKGYKIIERDFLRLADPYQFDLILMNPPFDNAAEHILHAWDLLKTFGGEIVSQVNVATIDNPYSFEREKLVRLIAQHGSVERIGQPYLKAQRTSNVEVAIVRLNRLPDGTPIDFGSSTDYEQDQQEKAGNYARNELASADRLAATVASYNAARQVIIEKSDLDGKFYFYTKGLDDKPLGATEEVIAKQQEADKSERKTRAKKLNESLSALKGRFWTYLFNRTKIAEIATSKVQAEFERFVAESKNLSFSVENIQNIFMQLQLNTPQIKDDCITQTFDKLCSYDGENILHREGWVTNDNYRVNQKVIIPIRAARWGGEWATWWDTREQVIANDIDKAICFVTGKEFLKIRTIETAVLLVTQAARAKTDGAWDGYGAAPAIYSEFFKIRIFKKGTIHLTFLDEDVWMKFNIEAAKGKNWIGAETEHKSEKTRTKHRKSVKKEYRAVYSN